MIGRPKGSGVTPLRIRFLEKIQPHRNGCWLWTGAVKRGLYGDYGMIWDGSEGRLWEGAHRVAYRLFRGPLPAKHVPDHQCPNTLCVNPWHLEAATHRENTLRGSGPPAVNVRKTHCPRGHAYDTGNTYMYGRTRQCLTCRNTYRQRRGEARL